MLFIQINHNIHTLDSFHSFIVKILQEFQIKGYNFTFIYDERCPNHDILIIQEIFNNVFILSEKKGGTPPYL